MKTAGQDTFRAEELRRLKNDLRIRSLFIVATAGKLLSIAARKTLCRVYTSLLLSLHQPFRVSAASNARVATSDHDESSSVALTASRSNEGAGRDAIVTRASNAVFPWRNEDGTQIR